jgi:HTH-type transcriptional regulator / antitoxin HigA
MATAARTTFQPDYAVPPGETVAELLDERGMTQTDLAARLGVSLKHVNGIVKRGEAISAEVALGLEKVFGVSATFWITRDAHYRATLAALEEARELENDLDWAKAFPVKDLKSRGYLPADAQGAALVGAILRFFGVADRRVWSPPAVTYRNSTKFESDEYALAAWLRVGEIRAGEIDCAPYDRPRFQKVLRDVRPLTRLDPQDWYPRLVSMCSDAGVAVVIEDTFPRCRANGATRWLSPSKALIQLSLRYRWEDVFWFTFFHEAGHLILHSKKAIIVETGKPPDGAAAPMEDEADRFASRTLVPVKHEPELRGLNVGGIPAFAERLGIAPAIIVGRLQHEGRLGYNVGNNLRRRLMFADDTKQRRA